MRKTKAEPGVDIVEIPIPECTAQDLIVKVKAAAMCKSDVDVIEWISLVAAANYKLPFTLGHEFSGEVVQVGSLVKNFKVGDRLAFVAYPLWHMLRMPHRQTAYLHKQYGRSG